MFLQYDPARGYDLAEVSRQVRLYEISDQLSAILPAGPGRRGGAAAAAGADAKAVTAAAADPAVPPVAVAAQAGVAAADCASSPRTGETPGS